MTLKLFAALTILVTASVTVVAQQDHSNAQGPKPSIEDARKLVQTISGDKDKLKAYCEIGKLDEQLDKAEEKGDAKEFESLVDKRDTLEQQLGPDYIRVIDGLGDIDPNSAEGQKFSAVFEQLPQEVR